VLSNCVAVRVVHEGGAARGVEAVAIDPVTRQVLGEVEIIAKRVCLSASATGTAALLLRSGARDPSGETGNTLRIHPAVIAAGDFEEPVKAWEGIPQTYECTEFLELDKPDGHRVWVLPAFAHPVGTATMVPGHGATHRALMERYPHLGVVTAMIHDLTPGKVRPNGKLGLSIEYWPDEADRAELSLGLWRPGGALAGPVGERQGAVRSGGQTGADSVAGAEGAGTGRRPGVAQDHAHREGRAGRGGGTPDVFGSDGGRSAACPSGQRREAPPPAEPVGSRWVAIPVVDWGAAAAVHLRDGAPRGALAGRLKWSTEIRRGRAALSWSQVATSARAHCRLAVGAASRSPLCGRMCSA